MQSTLGGLLHKGIPILEMGVKATVRQSEPGHEVGNADSLQPFASEFLGRSFHDTPMCLGFLFGRTPQFATRAAINNMTLIIYKNEPSVKSSIPS